MNIITISLNKSLHLQTKEGGLLKAINNTTVEVDFKEAIDNVNALKFTIDGLQVKNAVVKQTDKAVVVLTTAPQEGGKTYTVSESGKKLGTFQGVSAVIPTGISTVVASQQGVIGQQVTVSAQVKVTEGQSKAGIPVTFNIVNSNSNVNDKIEVEAYTDENGVATYTYTRYYSGTDNVVAYATDKSSVNDKAKVYWDNALQLTISDVTTDSTLANGKNKVYQIESKNNKNGYVFVTFAENLNVAPDKLVKTVNAQGVATYLLDSNDRVTTNRADYPYEATTGGKAVIAVKLDSNGKANLVLSGKNASVTPIVFEGEYVGNNNTPQAYKAKYDKTALQAKGSTVTFELKHELGLTVEAIGNANAATYINSTETGGRDYKVKYVDKEGKPVAQGSKVRVAIDTEGVTGTFRLLDADGNEVTAYLTDGKVKYYELTIGKDGETTFTVTSTHVNDYVTPVVFVDNGKTTQKLDDQDLQSKSETTYFVADVTYNAKLKVLGADGKEAKPVLANNSDYVDFVYELVDQNGKPRRASSATDVTFNITAGAGTIVTDNGDVAPGNSTSVTKTISTSSTKATTRVKAREASVVSVTATGSTAGVVLPTTEPTSATATFLSTQELVNGTVYTGTVRAVDKANNKVTLLINGKEHTVSYENGNYYIGGTNKSFVDFEDELSYGDTVKYVPGTTPYFDIIDNKTDTIAPSLSSATYAPAQPAKNNSYATGDIALASGEKLTFTATEYSAALNGTVVKLENDVNNNTTTTAIVGVDASGNTVITVELADDGTDIIATFQDVIDAVNTVTPLTKVSASTSDSTSTVADVGNTTLNGGSVAAPAQPATITLVFNEEVANTSEVEASVTVTDSTTVRSLDNPTFSWSSDKKTLTIILGPAHTVQTGDTVTVTNVKDAAGNVKATDSQILN